jgi:hypothetical protein
MSSHIGLPPFDVLSLVLCALTRTISPTVLIVLENMAEYRYKFLVDECINPPAHMRLPIPTMPPCLPLKFTYRNLALLPISMHV